MSGRDAIEPSINRHAPDEKQPEDMKIVNYADGGGELGETQA